MLKRSNKQLEGPGNAKLTVLRTVQAKLCYKTNKVQETLYVLKGQTSSLLSQAACVKLGLISRIDQINPTSNWKSEFPDLFKKCLGKLDTTYTIKLKREAEPVCIHASRKIARPLLPKVKQEIDSMLNKGVISPVTEPTSWCSGSLVVTKQNGSIRLCVDLAQLHKSVQREVHPMASVDDSLAKLAGSKIFSKLNARSGFWQIPLIEGSKHYTTFITTFGRYCFSRLPFGIWSASDIFQRTISTILGDMDGVIAHMDDILVHAKDQASHDQRLRKAMKWATGGRPHT